MKLFNFLFGWLFKTKKKPARNYPRNVKPGDTVIVEWSRIKGGMGALKCISNDPVTQKMLLEVKWNNPQEVPGTEPTERMIIDYTNSFFRNFNLLNPLKPDKEKNAEEEDEDENDIAKLQSDLNKALDAEEYDKARILQNKIDKILKR